MSSKRGKRGRPKKFVVKLVIKDEARLERTLGLVNVHGDKPHINDIIGDIVDRMEREEAAKSLALAKKWRSKSRSMYGWPSDCMDYLCMGGDYLTYDPCEGIYSSLDPRRLKSLNKKLYKRGSGKKGGKKSRLYDDEEDDYWNNRSSMYSNGEWSDDLLDDESHYEECYRSIKFYPDVENEDSYREFHSIKEFNDFCGDNGYILSTVDYEHIMNWNVVHCCLDPISLDYGDKEIITDNSYGGLYWTVSEDIVKKESLEHEPHYDGVEARTLTD